MLVLVRTTEEKLDSISAIPDQCTGIGNDVIRRCRGDAHATSSRGNNCRLPYGGLLVIGAYFRCWLMSNHSGKIYRLNVTIIVISVNVVCAPTSNIDDD